MSTWDKLREEILVDPETRAEYDRMEPRMKLVHAVVVARAERNWTQQHLAEACGMRQPAIARFERADTDPRLDTLMRIFHALDLDLEVVQRRAA